MPSLDRVADTFYEVEADEECDCDVCGKEFARGILQKYRTELTVLGRSVTLWTYTERQHYNCAEVFSFG